MGGWTGNCSFLEFHFSHFLNFTFHFSGVSLFTFKNMEEGGWVAGLGIVLFTFPPD